MFSVIKEKISFWSQFNYCQMIPVSTFATALKLASLLNNHESFTNEL